MKITIKTLFILFLFQGLVTNSFAQKAEDTLLGLWVRKHSNGIYFKKAQEFKSDRSGFLFKPDGALIVRAYVSECGQPVFEDCKGKWKVSGNRLRIKARVNNKMRRKTYRIMDLNNNELKLKK